jgi:hypothetical protein
MDTLGLIRESEHTARSEGGIQSPLDCQEISYKPIRVALQVSSGKLVISGISFLNQFTEGDAGWPMVNDRFGRHVKERQQMEGFAQRGLIYGYIGNSVPTIFQDGNTITLGSSSAELEEKILDPFPGTVVGSFSTDASSYFMADHDDFLGKGGRTDQHWEHQRPIIVSLEPGRYVVAHYYGLNPQGEGRTLYATITKSDEAIINAVCPEEILGAKIDSLFPAMDYLDIRVLKPFEEFEVRFLLQESEFSSAKVTIPADKISDDAFLQSAISSAWENKLIQQEQAKRQEVEVDASLRRMAAEDPQRFAELLASVRKALEP